MLSMIGPKSINAKTYYFNDTSFNNLMKNRIYHVLLISSNYDAFILEDDGRIDEQIFNEYVSLNLRYPPQFILASSEEKAFEILETENIDVDNCAHQVLLKLESMGLIKD